MKALYPLFEVGMEFEYFIHNRQGILNAQTVLAKELGFSIDQRGNGVVDLGNGTQVKTDGTCVELQMFAPHRYGECPKVNWQAINELPWLHKFQRGFWPYIKEGDTNIIYDKSGKAKPLKFIDPGKVYGSGKEIINAYSGERRWGKKEGTEDVTMRTAGLHLHFSVLSRSLGEVYPSTETEVFNTKVMGSFEHCNELIKLADKACKAIFFDTHTGGPVSKRSRLRIDNFQHWGDYRVKRDTETGNPTLEYRQLDPSMDYGTKLQAFCDHFNLLAIKYVSAL